jgi:hypothetical protein
VRDGSDPDLVEVAERAVALAGEPWDREVRVGGDPRLVGRAGPIEYGLIVRGEIHGAQLVLCESRRSGGTTPRLVTGALRSDGTFDAYTRTVANGGAAEDGTPPALSGAEVGSFLEGLLPPARLRLIAGELILCASAILSAELAAKLVDRLAALDRALPRPPGGPLR